MTAIDESERQPIEFLIAQYTETHRNKKHYSLLKQRIEKK